jgi:hypothetical protein
MCARFRFRSLRRASRRHEACDRFVHLRAPVALGQHFDLGRGRDLEPERDGNQRQPRRQIGSALLDFFAKTLGNDHLGIFTPEFHVFAQQLAPDGVRRGRGIGFARGVLLVEPAAAWGLEQAGLSDSVADDFDQPARPERALANAANHAQLGVTTGQWQALRRHLPPSGFARDPPPTPEPARPPFTANGSVAPIRTGARTIEHVGRRVNLPGSPGH